MARPKIHGDRVEWKIRVPVDLAEKVDADCLAEGKTRTDWLVDLIAGCAWFESPVTPRTSPPKPITGDNNPSNCPHKHRVLRGAESLCLACGDTR